MYNKSIVLKLIATTFIFVALASVIYLLTSTDASEEDYINNFVLENQNPDGGFSTTTVERKTSYYDTYYIRQFIKDNLDED
ncbi:hypothetical protein [Shouchella miscanthi]|uniref:Uncharacterized protein n=1 Tax=Shouchella miscanthi TaxID=2598861 RepID=A0ABU6NQE1_9BACI|nr:hypothetical protein [Shouchella miscanthi]